MLNCRSNSYSFEVLLFLLIMLRFAFLLLMRGNSKVIKKISHSAFKERGVNKFYILN